ncbi:hypothetical protein [Nocardia sp. CA-135398]|uniref:hypothetical protein n=1 Tax=Nocardia sp. CA-135398 TaxID=3239977 RepID=UPI003D99DCD2
MDVPAAYFGRMRKLVEFRDQGLDREPSNRAIAKAVKRSPSQVKKWLYEEVLPTEPAEMLKLVSMVRSEATRRGALEKALDDLLDADRWAEAYRAEIELRAKATGHDMRAGQARKALQNSRPGISLAEHSVDPILHLRVQRAIDLAAAADLPAELTLYVRRQHDDDLARVVRTCVDRGASAIVVLVGGSSTGKTRACWEAVRGLETPWRLWYPTPSALARDIGNVGPNTVIWLDDNQDHFTEHMCERLTELLADPTRSPVLVIGTLWRKKWRTLTADPPGEGPAEFPNARALLSGHGIEVPGTFTPLHEADLTAAAHRDPRLAYALDALADVPRKQLIQFLAGVPVLIDRFRHGTAPETALIEAAMDARRLGVGPEIPVDFLVEAACGYFSEVDWHSVAPDWFHTALVDVSLPARGFLGPLSRNKPQTLSSIVPETYSLAPYLEQLGSIERAAALPPPEFWNAALVHLGQGEALALLGSSADQLGHSRWAAESYKQAVRIGSDRGAYLLLATIADIDPDHIRATAEWLTAHCNSTDPYEIYNLAAALQSHGLDDLAHPIYARAAEHMSFDRPDVAAVLAERIHELGVREVTSVLLARHPGHHMSLANPREVHALLRLFREMQADDELAPTAREQFTILAARMARTVTPGTSFDLRWLMELGADAEVRDAVDRIVRQNKIRDLVDLCRVIEMLHDTASGDKLADVLGPGFPQAAILHDANPDDLCRLLRLLRDLDAEQQLTSLIDALRTQTSDRDNTWMARLHMICVELRVPADIIARLPADLRSGVPDLSDSIDRNWYIAAILAPENRNRRARSVQETATALVDIHDRAIAEAILNAVWDADGDLAVSILVAAADRVEPNATGTIAILLEALRELERDSDITSLLARGVIRAVDLTDPAQVAILLTELTAGNHTAHLTQLLARSPAGSVELTDPEGLTQLLNTFHAIDAEQQLTILAGRIAEDTEIVSPSTLLQILCLFSELGQIGPCQRLLSRKPVTKLAIGDQLSPYFGTRQLRWVAPELLQMLESLDATDQAEAFATRLATEIDLNRAGTAADIANALKANGKHAQFSALSRRAANSGFWKLHLKLEPDSVNTFRYGRELDGATPSPSWGWNDLT